MKTCSKCLLDKEDAFFYKRNSYKDGYSTWCISCTLMYSKQYKVTHMDDKRIKQNEWRRKTNYRKIRYHGDINYKLAHKLRTRLNTLLKGKVSWFRSARSWLFHK